MKLQKSLQLFIAAVCFASTAHAKAQTSTRSEVEALKQRIEELENSMGEEEGTLSPETEDLMRLRLELQLPSRLNASFTGLGPGVSKVYFSNTPLSIGGFGEFKFFGISGVGANGTTPNDSKTSRVLSFSPFVGFRFSREIVFNSGYSLTQNKIEFAYLDFLFGKETGVRVGHVLVPFGLTNLRFEPNLFHQLNRPINEVLIVPTLWHENGVLLFSRFGDLLLQGGIVNGENIAEAEDARWVRYNSASTSRKMHDLAGVLRAELTGQSELFMNSNIGASLYYGNSAQDHKELGDAPVFLASLHGELRHKRLAGQFSYTEGHIGDTDKIATLAGKNIGAGVRGANVTLAYDLLDRPAASDSSPALNSFNLPVWRELPIFVSWEFADLQADAPKGVTKDDNMNSSTWTFGFNFKPHPQIVLKADYAMSKNDAGRKMAAAECGLGFSF